MKKMNLYLTMMRCDTLLSERRWVMRVHLTSKDTWPLKTEKLSLMLKELTLELIGRSKEGQYSRQLITVRRMASMQNLGNYQLRVREPLLLSGRVTMNQQLHLLSNSACMKWPLTYCYDMAILSK